MRVTLQAYLVSRTGSYNEANNNNLEIDEVEIEQEEGEENEILLASAVITKEKPSRERYVCPIWSQGLERSFKVFEVFNKVETQSV